MKLVMLKRAYPYCNRWKASWELRDGKTRVPLCEAEGRIILALLGNPYLTRMEMLDVLWPDPHDMPDFWLNSLKQRIRKINRKLVLFCHRIVSDWGIYRLKETAPERMAA